MEIAFACQTALLHAAACAFHPCEVAACVQYEGEALRRRAEAQIHEILTHAVTLPRPDATPHHSRFIMALLTVTSPSTIICFR